MKARNRGDQSANARRDSDRHVKNVVQHQGRGRHQPRPNAKIFFRNCVCPAACRISSNRLTVGDVKDRQQRDDDQRDRDDVIKSHNAEWQENRERGLWPIG